jgi:hypothetical protein
MQGGHVAAHSPDGSRGHTGLAAGCHPDRCARTADSMAASQHGSRRYAGQPGDRGLT